MLQDCLIYAQLLVPGLVSQLICFCAIWLLVVQPHNKLSIGSWMTRVGEIRQFAAPTVRGTNSVSGSKISVRTRAESTASETQCTPVHLKNTIKVVHFPPYLSPRTSEFYSQKSQISVDLLTRLQPSIPGSIASRSHILHAYHNLHAYLSLHAHYSLEAAIQGPSVTLGYIHPC